jgi:hypothetical protein
MFASHAISASILVEIGAVEFFSQLIFDFNDQGHSWVATSVEIRERLVRLPRQTPVPDNDEHSEHGSPPIPLFSSGHGSRDTTQTPLSMMQGHAPSTATEPPNELQSRQHPYAGDPTSHWIAAAAAAAAANGSGGGGDRDPVGTVGTAGTAYADTRPRFAQNDYTFGGSGGRFDNFACDHQPTQLNGFERVSLAASDITILHTTATTLSASLQLHQNLQHPHGHPTLQQSALPTQHRFVTTCKFFKENLLEDFPAEVFLQQPAILQSLVQLLSCRESICTEEG